MDYIDESNQGYCPWVDETTGFTRKSSDGVRKQVNQGYCPWVDETTGFTRKSSDGVRKQVAIPKKMKKLIDGDLASLTESVKFSTKERLREKLRRKNQEKENQKVQQTNNREHAVNESNGTNSRRESKRRKRKKKVSKSEEMCDDIGNDVQKKEVREKQKDEVFNNNEIQFEQPDEGEESVEKNGEAKNEAEKVDISWDNEMNDNFDCKDVVKSIEKCTTVLDLRVNTNNSIEKVNVENRFYLNAIGLSRSQRLVKDTCSFKTLVLAQNVNAVNDYLRKGLKRKAFIQGFLLERMWNVLMMKIGGGGMLKLEMIYFSSDSFMNSAADVNMIGQKNKGNLIIEVANEKEDFQVSNENSIVGEFEERKSVTAKGNDQIVHSPGHTLDYTDESHQGYCPWVDETTGFKKKASHGARYQLAIPKKMKKLIDRDFASLTESGKYSTRDRLREKLRRKQQEKENQKVQQTNNREHAVNESNGTNSRKQSKRRKRKKKVSKSEEMCDDIGNDVQKKEVREKQKDEVFNNNEIQFEKPDEGEESGEENGGAKNEAEKVEISCGNEMNDNIDCKAVVKSIEKCSTVLDVRVNINNSIEKVNVGNRFYLNAIGLSRSQRLVKDTCSFKNLELAQNVNAVNDYPRKGLKRKAFIQVFLLERMWNVLMTKIGGGGMLKLGMIYFSSDSFMNSSADVNMIGQKNKGNLIIEVANEKEDIQVSNENNIVGEFEERKSVTAKGNDQIFHSSGQTLDYTDEFHQGYCPWVDETTGFKKKSSDGARNQLPIPKKMKKLIDRDLASLTESGKFSTKDRLREKLRRKAQEIENKKIQQTIIHENAVTESNGTNSRKQSKRKNRKKKVSKSEEMCDNIGNNVKKKEVRKKQKESVHRLEVTYLEENCLSTNEATEKNDAIKYEKPDEGEEAIEESYQAKYKTEKANSSRDNERNENIGYKDFDKATMKCSTIYDVRVNINNSTEEQNFESLSYLKPVGFTRRQKVVGTCSLKMFELGKSFVTMYEDLRKNMETKAFIQICLLERMWNVLTAKIGGRGMLTLEMIHSRDSFLDSALDVNEQKQKNKLNLMINQVHDEEDFQVGNVYKNVYGNIDENEFKESEIVSTVINDQNVYNTAESRREDVDITISFTTQEALAKVKTSLKEDDIDKSTNTRTMSMQRHEVLVSTGVRGRTFDLFCDYFYKNWKKKYSNQICFQIDFTSGTLSENIECMIKVSKMLPLITSKLLNATKQNPYMQTLTELPDNVTNCERYSSRQRQQVALTGESKLENALNTKDEMTLEYTRLTYRDSKDGACNKVQARHLSQIDIVSSVDDEIASNGTEIDKTNVGVAISKSKKCLQVIVNIKISSLQEGVENVHIAMIEGFMRKRYAELCYMLHTYLWEKQTGQTFDLSKEKKLLMPLVKSTYDIRHFLMEEISMDKEILMEGISWKEEKSKFRAVPNSLEMIDTIMNTEMSAYTKLQSFVPRGECIEVKYSIEVTCNDMKIKGFLKLKVPHVTINLNGAFVAANTSQKVSNVQQNEANVVSIEKDIFGMLVGIKSIQSETFKKNMIKKNLNSSYLEHILQNKSRPNRAMYSMAKKDFGLIQQKFSKDQYLSQNNTQVQTTVNDVFTNQRLKGDIVSNNSVKTFLSKLHTDMFKKSCSANNDNILKRKQRLAIPQATLSYKLITNPHKISITKIQRSGCLLETPTKERDDMGEIPKNCSIQNICSRKTEQYTTSTQQQEIEEIESTQVSSIEIVEQSHYGLRLCMFD